MRIVVVNISESPLILVLLFHRKNGPHRLLLVPPVTPQVELSPVIAWPLKPVLFQYFGSGDRVKMQKNLVVYEWPDPFPRFGDRFLISVFYRTYWPIGPFTAIALGHNLEIAQNRWLNEWTTKKTQIWDPQSGVWLETFCAIVDGISVPHSVALPTAGSVWSH